MSHPLAIDAVEAAIADLPADSLSEARRAALQHLREQGLPTKRHEDWKYTDLTSVIEISNAWLGGARSPGAAAGAAIAPAAIDAHWLVIADGRVLPGSLEAAEPGTEICLLSQAGRSLDFAAPLADLNVALLHDGLLIRVGAGVSLTKPIGILVTDSSPETAGVAQVRVEIEVEAGAKAEFVEYHLSAGEARHYANSVVNLGIGDAAAVDYVRLQQRAAGHCQTTRLAARLGRDSVFRHGAFDLGGSLVRNDLHIDIAAPGATAEFAGLYLGSGQQHIDNHTRVDHRVGPARSEQEYRGIVGGEARCVWNGKAIVHAGADGTDAQQANHNLLLSAAAEVDAKPELEIYADDVKCSHGTTIGQLDETSLYYLRTRGLDRREARRILTLAFAHNVVGKAPIPAIHEFVTELIDARLADLAGEEEQ